MSGVAAETRSGTGQAPISIRVEYYALFKACARKEAEDLVLADSDPARLYEDLRLRYRFPLHRTLVHLAVNDAFAPWDRSLAEGDTVVFVPPVSGG
jgi:molybdopterin converting factor small subunit